MSKHVIDKATDTAANLYKQTKGNIHHGKKFIKKAWIDFKNYVLTQNQKADQKSIGRDRPNLTGGMVITKRAKNGGHI